ncbi:MAG TPA: hypothetical protein VF723_02580 [Pyrinomonadaceae bacterium]|jgi:hypothetical protein
MRRLKQLTAVVPALALLCLMSASARAQAAQDEEGTGAAESAAVKQLTSRDPLVRQRGAEELARLEATGQRRLVEGYRLQEKNARVRLALDWALFRMGKAEALLTVIRALDSQRYNQAHEYLAALGDPEPLYYFLDKMNGNTQAMLLEVLARIGDAGTLERLKPFAESFDPKVAEAAAFAAREITRRLDRQPAQNTSTRPRQVGKEEAGTP